MPYITAERKSELASGQIPPEDLSAGDLNYLVTGMAIMWVTHKKLNYENLNAAYGALTAAANEFYRRLVAPYEDRKIAENGDVYPSIVQPQIAVPPEPQIVIANG